MGLIVWSPLAGGFLTGKYTREHQGSSEDRHAKLAFPPIDTERVYPILDVLQDIARAHEATVAQIALAWLLHQQAVTTVIVGAKRIDQLQDNLGASGLILNEAELSRLDEVSRLPVEYPGWPFMELDEDIIRKHGQN